MRGIDIVLQLKSIIPQINNRFTDELSVTSLTKNVTEITATTLSAHGLVTNDYVNILGANTPNTIASMSRAIIVSSITRNLQYAVLTSSISHKLKTGDVISVSGSVEAEFNVSKIRIDVINANQLRYYIGSGPAQSATGTITLTARDLAYATTLLNHDLTETSKSPGASVNTVEIVGADQADYNGTKILRGVISETQFVFDVSNEPVPATGTPRLLENKVATYNGLQVVKAAPTTTTFTYDVEIEPIADAEGTILSRFNHRISGVASDIVASDSYTRQADNNYWMFVKLGGVAASKSRHTSTDATAVFNNGSAYSQEMIVPFSVYVFAPTTNEIAAFLTRDYMQFIMSTDLISALCGVRFQNPFTEPQWALTISTGHDEFDYAGPYYSHQFDFETTERVNSCDIIGNETVALRKVDLNYLIKDAGSEEFSKQDTVEFPE